MLKALLIVSLLLLALVGLRSWMFSFIAQRPKDYATTGPAFDPLAALAGEIVSEGLVYGPTGRVATRFVARMEGSWSGTTGTLTEHFVYDSGREQKREWRLSLQPGGRITAEADDIIGTAVGQISGASLRLTYRLRLPQEAGGHVLDVVDWLYLMPDGTILNRSQMRRFGITLAELVATMRPVHPDD